MDTIELYELLKEHGLLEDNGEIFEIQSDKNIIYGYNGYICKVSNNPTKLKNESEILKKLEYKGKFPNFVYYGKLGFDKYVLITKVIPGTPIDNHWNDLTTEEKDLLTNDIVESIKIIHSVNCDKNNFVDYIKNKSFEYYNIIKENAYFDISEIDTINNELQENISSFDCVNGVCNLIHNDLIHNNILILDKNLSGIVDFELSLCAPSYIELFNLYYNRDVFILNKEAIEFDSVEVDFINHLIESLNSQYSQLFDYTPIQYKCYNIFRYLELLSKVDESNFTDQSYLKFKEFYGL